MLEHYTNELIWFLDNYLTYDEEDDYDIATIEEIKKAILTQNATSGLWKYQVLCQINFLLDLGFLSITEYGDMLYLVTKCTEELKRKEVNDYE